MEKILHRFEKEEKSKKKPLKASMIGLNLHKKEIITNAKLNSDENQMLSILTKTHDKVRLELNEIYQGYLDFEQIEKMNAGSNKPGVIPNKYEKKLTDINKLHPQHLNKEKQIKRLNNSQH